MRAVFEGLKQLRRYPSAVAGLAIILVLVCIAVWTIIAIPYDEAVDQWRGDEKMWIEYPRNARPAWTNWFRKKKEPETIIVSSEGAERKENRTPGQGGDFDLALRFDYPYESFPSELNLFFTSRFREKNPFVQLSWETPDGRVFALGNLKLKKADRFAISVDAELQRKLGGKLPQTALFSDPASDPPRALPGKYTLRVRGVTFEDESSVEARLVVYGRVQGWAGTDHRRRDLMVALLWGVPVALGFGLLAAVGTTVTTLLIAATGVWFGKWVDGLIQRVTEVNMVLPLLPILIMIGTLYSTKIWWMLGAVIALGIFSVSVKVYRAMLLPVKNSAYIEAARAYGAGDFRIILRYLIPRVLPVLIPGFVSLIPTYVFLEASLAVLGLGDPILPTWGKVLNDAQANGALWKGYYYWVLEPCALLMLTGLGFAMLGFALDRIFNPRLRKI